MPAPTRNPAGFRVLFTAELINGLQFERYPFGCDAKGRLAYSAPLATMADWMLRDSAVPGFGVRLTRNGAKSYFVQARQKKRGSVRLVLPRCRSLKEARLLAGQWLAAMARGEDPREKIESRLAQREHAAKRDGQTLATLFEDYVSGGVGLKPKTMSDRTLAARWASQTPLWSKPVHLITASETGAVFGPMFEQAAAAALDRVANPDVKRTRGAGPQTDVASMHKLLRHCTSAWNMSELTERVENPFSRWRGKNKKLPKVMRRTSILPLRKESGQTWLKALVDLLAHDEFGMAQMATYVLCLLLWGARRTEVQKLRWSDIDRADAIVHFRAAHTKAGVDQFLPLGPWALELLAAHQARAKAKGHSVAADAWVWPSESPGMHLTEFRSILTVLRDRSGLWINAHDLRRTVATDIYGDTGDVATVGIALGHSSESVTMGYIQERLAVLRPLYITRERRLRQSVGLEAAGSAAALTDAQSAILRAAAAMMRQADIDPLRLVEFVA